MKKMSLKRTAVKEIGVDKLFAKKRQQIIDFSFAKDTAIVFDDMLVRSVPMYKELQVMMAEIAREYALEGSNVYDLGCSTGVTLLNMNKYVKPGVKFIGIDYSKDMLEEFKTKLDNLNLARKIELLSHDLNNDLEIMNASVVVLNLTLQFIRPVNRDSLIRAIYKGLRPGGCLIMVEKVLGNNPQSNQLFIKLYYDMKKRNGYSELEIAQKREALENILVPYKIDENLKLLIRNGFEKMDIFFKCYNFTGIIAIKEQHSV